jgi:hypothetical protein
MTDLYISLPEQINANAIIEGAVRKAKIVGVEIASDNDADNKLVVIVDDGVVITARRVDVAYTRDFYAEAELERRQ